MKRVFSSFNQATVYHVRNLLQNEGIQAVVKNEFLSSAMGDLPPAECQAEVWVLHEKDFQAAETVLLVVGSRQDLPSWKCACGETCEGQFTQCWRCGTFRES